MCRRSPFRHANARFHPVIFAKNRDVAFYFDPKNPRLLEIDEFSDTLLGPPITPFFCFFSNLTCGHITKLRKMIVNEIDGRFPNTERASTDLRDCFIRCALQKCLRDAQTHKNRSTRTRKHLTPQKRRHDCSRPFETRCPIGT